MNIRDVDVVVAARLPRGLKVDRMVISGQTPLARKRTAGAVVWPLDEERPAGPSELRAAYASVLKRCCGGMGRGRTVVLPFYAAGLELSAAARIAAQEVFRFIRAAEDPQLPAKIILRTKSPRDADRLKAVVEGYLGHIRHVLAWGPFVTVDTIIETGRGVVLIRRKNPPFGWALPGGFVDYGESLEEAAAREAAEETGLRVCDLRQMHTYSAPGRDPRFQTITTVFVARAQGRPKAASDAGAVGIFSSREWKKLDLAFDHREVLEDYLKFKKR